MEELGRLQILKESDIQPAILYPVKLSSKHEQRPKIISDIENLQKKITSYALLEKLPEDKHSQHKRVKSQGKGRMRSRKQNPMQHKSYNESYEPSLKGKQHRRLEQKSGRQLKCAGNCLFTLSTIPVFLSSILYSSVRELLTKTSRLGQAQ